MWGCAVRHKQKAKKFEIKIPFDEIRCRNAPVKSICRIVWVYLLRENLSLMHLEKGEEIKQKVTNESRKKLNVNELEVLNALLSAIPRICCFLPLCDACWSWISLAIDFLTARHFCDLFATDKKINLTRCLDTLITKCLSVTVDNNFWQVLQATIKCGCAIKVDENAVLSFMTWKLW